MAPVVEGACVLVLVPVGAAEDLVAAAGEASQADLLLAGETAVAGHFLRCRRSAVVLVAAAVARY